MEYNFKAIKKNTDTIEWVYGDLMQDKLKGKTYIISKIVDDCIQPTEVYPQTVSFFTGYLDKNGIAIYTNDIVNYLSHKNMVVTYEDGHITMSNGQCTDSAMSNKQTKEWCEIVGNKFETMTPQQHDLLTEVLQEILQEVLDYLKVPNLEEAEKLSMLESTMTYDVVVGKIEFLARKYGLQIKGITGD